MTKASVGIEVQTFDLRQRVVAITEEESELLRRLPLVLQEEAVRLRLLEAEQRHVVGQEVGVVYAQDVADMQRVAPDGVLSHVRFPRGFDAVVQETYHLALLSEDEVAVGILQGIDAIVARCHTLDGELSATVGARNADHGLGVEERVLEVFIESHQDSLDGLQVLCVQTVAAHLEGVDTLTC